MGLDITAEADIDRMYRLLERDLCAVDFLRAAIAGPLPAALKDGCQERVEILQDHVAAMRASIAKLGGDKARGGTAAKRQQARAWIRSRLKALHAASERGDRAELDLILCERISFVDT
jgi:hypothetical protein